MDFHTPPAPGLDLSALADLAAASPVAFTIGAGVAFAAFAASRLARFL